MNPIFLSFFQGASVGTVLEDGELDIVERVIGVREVFVEYTTPSVIGYFAVDAGFVVIDTKAEIFGFADVLYLTFGARQAVHYKFAATVYGGREFEIEFFLG